MAPGLPPVTPPNLKSLPHPMYNVWTNPNGHVQVFQKAIQANGERNDLDIVILFCFTLRDAISKWGENFMQSHSECTFFELEAAFSKQYWKVQIDE